MEWLSLEQALAQGFQVRGDPPQYLELPAELDRLASQIPTPAHFEQIGIAPSPSYQWFARIGERAIIVEREKPAINPEGRVFVYTNYLPKQNELGDWTSLLDLAELPSSIYVTRPRYILSRTLDPEHVLFRPDEMGNNLPVYNAASRHDAEGLLAFLKQDSFNELCFIGPPSLIRDPSG